MKNFIVNALSLINARLPLLLLTTQHYFSPISILVHLPDVFIMSTKSYSTLSNLSVVFTLDKNQLMANSFVKGKRVTVCYMDQEPDLSSLPTLVVIPVQDGFNTADYVRAISLISCIERAARLANLI